MANIKAYVLVEYIGPKKETGDSKTFHNWCFDTVNEYKCRIPSDIADMAMEHPDLFIVHDEISSHPTFDGKDLQEVFDTINRRLRALEVAVAVPAEEEPEKKKRPPKE